MDRFRFAEVVRDLIENRSMYEVVEFEESDGSITVQVGKKKFTIEVKEV